MFFINSIIGMAANVGHYTKACDDEWVVIRFVDELKVIAMFVGPSYSLSDLRSSARRIWPRYFGASAVPFNFFERLFPLMKIVASSRSLILDGHLSKCFLGQPCYPLGDALYELVAITVFKRWFGDCPYPTIPFEYIELAGNGPPDLIAVYEPEFPGRGRCSIFFFPFFVKISSCYLLVLITRILTIHTHLCLLQMCLSHDVSLRSRKLSLLVHPGGSRR